MSSDTSASEERNFSFGCQNVDSNNSEHLLGSQSQEKQAIAACVERLDESTYRSPSHRSAIETLRDLEDSKILELLSIIRLPGWVLHLCREDLSRAQLDALSCLKLCPDSHILLWLRHCRGREQTLSSDLCDMILIHSGSGEKPVPESTNRWSSYTSECCDQ